MSDSLIEAFHAYAKALKDFDAEWEANKDSKVGHHLHATMPTPYTDHGGMATLSDLTEDWVGDFTTMMGEKSLTDLSDFTSLSTEWTLDTLLGMEIDRPFEDSGRWYLEDKQEYLESVMLKAPLTPIVLGEYQKRPFVIDGNLRLDAITTLYKRRDDAASVPITLIRPISKNNPKCSEIRRRLNK